MIYANTRKQDGVSKKKLAGTIIGSVIGTVVIAIVIAATVAPGQMCRLIVGVTPSGAGSVSPLGGQYEPGVQVTVTASPSSGYSFDYWSGSASRTAPTVTITMDSDKILIAHFKSTTQVYTLAISINPSDAGSVSPSGGEYDSGVQITLTATPSDDYTFDYWSGHASGTLTAVTITMDSDKDVTAYFQKKAPAVEATVTRVVDGDTIVVSLEGITYRVRYIGIDTPETVHPSQPVECFGREASDKNSELVAGKTVRLEKDISETDKYGRLLRYVWVGDVFVNDYLVRQGYAYASTYPPDVKYAEQFAQAQSEAEANNRGLWAVCE